VGALVAERGWSVVNIDSVIVAERPRLKPHIGAMGAAIAARMGLSADQVGVKATTNEKLGAEGREEGISCHAVALLQK
jgi:2-C-methyl-D-erythritol 2,4-cyclodiphosphate synthase